MRMLWYWVFDMYSVQYTIYNSVIAVYFTIENPTYKKKKKNHEINMINR